MKALVTGGTGFVGSHLVEVLVAHGVTVTALVRSPGKAEELRRLEVAQVAGDLSDAERLREACRGQDVVYHVAGLVAARNEKEFLSVNRDGAGRLASAAADERVSRFVLVSSLAAAGPSDPGRPLGGGETERPVTAYGRSKLFGERAVIGSGVPTCILRPPLVYGPRDTELLRVFKVARSGIAPVFGDGEQELSAVYGPDLAEALLAVGTAEGTIGKVYYPCHEERFTTAALAANVGNAVGREVRVVRIPQLLGRTALTLIGWAARVAGRATLLNRDKANEFFQAAWTGDPETLHRDTGWRASHALREGLAATASWYREQEWI